MLNTFFISNEIQIIILSLSNNSLKNIERAISKHYDYPFNLLFSEDHTCTMIRHFSYDLNLPIVKESSI